ncbi:uncharacterized protein DS421_10g303540 [Arachis hypogaea]|nr:uncharacterized protein DS421_10g303540 [Arachis hypogaea]
MFSIGHDEVTAEGVNEQIGRVRGGTDWSEHNGLGGHELLPLRTARSVDPGNEDRETVQGIGSIGLRLSGGGVPRRMQRGGRRRIATEMDPADGANPVRSGADDAQIADSS